MTNISKTQFGFTLIELLVATFIFTSLLAVAYNLMNSTLLSKKELELSLNVNEQVKNANEILQGVLRQADGDFFTDGEFGISSFGGQTAHLFLLSDNYVSPNSNGVLPVHWDSIYKGNNLYVKTKEGNEKKIYIFQLKKNQGQEGGTMYIESWVYNQNAVSNHYWKQDQSLTELLNFGTNLESYFSIPIKVDNNGNKLPLSVYNPSLGELPPMDIYLKLRVTAVNNWQNKKYQRQLNQIYVPLVISNPYL